MQKVGTLIKFSS